MSDSSSLSNALPSDSVLEDTLRHAVQQIYRSRNLEDLTVKRVRRTAEKQLNLEDGYFKTNSVWKEKSKRIIQSEVEALGDPASSQASPHKEPSPKASSKSAKPQVNGKKRATTDVPGAKGRRQKKPHGDQSGSEDEKDRQKVATEGAEIGPLLHGAASEAMEGADLENSSSKGAKSTHGAGVDGSESEMSAVLDEAPKPRSKRKSLELDKGPSKKKSKTSKAPKAELAADPDAEEIKRLQGWLVKCGIRKMWYKELQPYETPKAKIRHLKEMLSEAGMTGRYSVEKASQIREERELKADLDAVQAGNKQWGMGTPEEDGNGRPKRRLAKGLKELDFLNDDDGDETD